MTTSANVTYYGLYLAGTLIREYSQHAYCKARDWKKDLAEYVPPEHYTVIARHPDEDEVDHYSQPMSLVDFLSGTRFVWEGEGFVACPWCEGDGVVAVGGETPVRSTLFKEVVEALEKTQENFSSLVSAAKIRGRTNSGIWEDEMDCLSDSNVRLLAKVKEALE